MPQFFTRAFSVLAAILIALSFSKDFRARINVALISVTTYLTLEAILWALVYKTYPTFSRKKSIIGTWINISGKDYSNTKDISFVIFTIGISKRRTRLTIVGNVYDFRGEYQSCWESKKNVYFLSDSCIYYMYMTEDRSDGQNTGNYTGFCKIAFNKVWSGKSSVARGYFIDDKSEDIAIEASQKLGAVSKKIMRPVDTRIFRVDNSLRNILSIDNDVLAQDKPEIWIPKFYEFIKSKYENNL